MNSASGNVTPVNAPSNTEEEAKLLEVPCGTQHAKKVRDQIAMVVKTPRATTAMVAGRCGRRLLSLRTLVDPSGEACPTTAVHPRTLPCIPMLRSSCCGSVRVGNDCRCWWPRTLHLRRTIHCPCVGEACWSDTVFGCALRQFLGCAGGCVFAQLLNT